MYGSSGTPTWTTTWRPSGTLARCSIVRPGRLIRAEPIVRCRSDAAPRAGRARAPRSLSTALGPARHRPARRLVHHAEDPLDLAARPLVGLHRPLPRTGAESGGRPARAAARPAGGGNPGRLGRDACCGRADPVALHPHPPRPGPQLLAPP